MIDADTYDEVFVFDTFFAEVWGLAVSSIGDFFVTVSGDKSIKVWRQTAQQAFVTDEQEYRQEKLMLKEAENEYNEIDLAQDAQTNPFSKDKVVKIETGAALKRSADTIKYGEDLMFALELADEFRQEVD
jgi:U3 small nucleolar RNA-associated protein 12